ncbi:LLM class flavin-dependent oxidoreductase [Gluconobacter wancherniae]|uniref:LLM class flavin-dependent oxidoreductase n=1 Tax=Gluconobacter wancherniae TaxID=1307955 RepID=UPI00201136D2|nr:LLM class flavin-dependent oxidoreductase [Gluconobacter wancherniae]
MERLRPNSGALACLRKGIRTMTFPTPNTSRDRYMVLNAFTMATVSHLNYGLWRHPADQTHRYKDVNYWVDLAKLLDREGFDCLFIADALGQIDVYGNSPAPALKHGIQSPLIDPLMLVSAMAAATKSLGFGITLSTTYEHPYQLARKLTTLDHLTKGRMGWNVVTSQQESAARNLGLERQIPHDERYERADEFMDVVYKLWMNSWENDAVIRDQSPAGSGNWVYTDPGKVHPIHHDGKYFHVPDAHVSEPSPQRVPVILQAGASARGIDFAARHAEVIFVVGADAAGTKANVRKIREEAEKLGRDPASLKFISAAAVVVGETEAEALEKFRDYKTWYDPIGSIIHYSSMTGVDFSQTPTDNVVTYRQTEASQSVLSQFDPAKSGRSWTLAEATSPKEGFGRARTFVGDAKAVADQIESWLEASETDGINLIQIVNPGSYLDFARLVLPELRSRGRIRPQAAGTLRQNLFPGLASGIPATSHPSRCCPNS